MIGMPPPISLRTPGVMTTAELATWARIGKNAVPLLVARFSIREVTGNVKCHRYPVAGALRATLGITAKTPDDLELLLVPLQKASWVSQVTGLSVSASGAAACENRGPLPTPVELTATGPRQAAARGRRWIPALFECTPVRSLARRRSSGSIRAVTVSVSPSLRRSRAFSRTRANRRRIKAWIVLKPLSAKVAQPLVNALRYEFVQTCQTCRVRRSARRRTNGCDARC